ncbi:MAG: restriction endonuclease [Candidatus Omnitrophica bacterium]|nr:restriction endonuclease [Candidatus Omnitrophota bacterium]
MPKSYLAYVENIKTSGLSIYDSIKIGDPKLWIPSKDLEAILNKKLKGLSLKDLPLRTRSKVVKTAVCQALGYPVPSSFRKENPRFPGQNFDTYAQKANNLQVWNEDLDGTRRYVIIKINVNDEVERVKVVTGETLSFLDTTGTLTQKYQARLNIKEAKAELINDQDTDNIQRMLSKSAQLSSSPIDYPTERSLYPIKTIFKKLKLLIGTTFNDPGYDQERNRGSKLHKLICKSLDYNSYKDDGRFPDICNQLLEVKLQMSPTIDLGLVCPNSEEIIDFPMVKGHQIRHCDIRYALFYAKTDGKEVTLTHLYITSGESFFLRFPQFQGKVLNKKIQMHLPNDFFSA